MIKNDILTIISDYLEQHYILGSFVLAAVVCMLRKRSTNITSRVMDSLLCGSVSTGLSYGIISILDINVYICFFVGTSVGYLGTEEIKRILLSRLLG